MIKIELNKNDYDFINDLIKLDIEEKKSNKYVIRIDEKKIEKILDLLSDYLVKEGLNYNDEPNDLGLYIEKLIDTFSENLYE